MPQPHTLRITEIFPSIQGEGLRQGEATIFIRLSGCNLRCPFCDTKSAWEGGKEFSLPRILEKVQKLSRRFPARWVCLTGGEPLLQRIEPLAAALKKGGFKVQVETNATLYRPLTADWYSISPKPDDYFYQPEYKTQAKEVKLIVTRGLDLRTVRRLRREFPEVTPLLLQPQSNRTWSMARAVSLLREASRAGLKNIRISIQLHKVYGLR